MELGTAAPETSTHEPPPEPAHDTPIPIADPPTERAADGSENPKVPSPARTDDPQDPDVEIIKTVFAEPGSFWNVAGSSLMWLITLI